SFPARPPKRGPPPSPTRSKYAHIQACLFPDGIAPACVAPEMLHNWTRKRFLARCSAPEAKLPGRKFWLRQTPYRRHKAEPPDTAALISAAPSRHGPPFLPERYKIRPDAQSALVRPYRTGVDE